MAKGGRPPKLKAELDKAALAIGNEDAALVGVLDQAVAKIAHRINQEVHAAKLRDLTFMFGVLTDKRAMLKGATANHGPRTQVNVQINGADVSPEGLREMLAGKVRPAKVVRESGSLPEGLGVFTQHARRRPQRAVPAAPPPTVPADSNSVLTSVPLSSAAAQQVTMLPASGASCFATAGPPPPAPIEAGGAGVQAPVPAPDRVVHSP